MTALESSRSPLLQPEVLESFWFYSTLCHQFENKTVIMIINLFTGSKFLTVATGIELLDVTS
jgi:hypothetical protein